ncbi:MAG TPA: hypothetical protein VK832_03160 [Burkholderiaceae bacterium]|jgi:hypothetical protein|nr:hypothetical protein [Burkholderiaceae bacterium]
MNRFFFDYTTEDQSLCDYRGLEFRSIQGAIDFAHATVQNLSHSLSNKWMGWSVEIRDAEGNKFFSLPVGHEALHAASSSQ